MGRGKMRDIPFLLISCYFAFTIPASTGLTVSCPTFDIVPNTLCLTGDFLSFVTSKTIFKGKSCGTQLHQKTIVIPEYEEEYILSLLFKSSRYHTAVGFDCRIRVGKSSGGGNTNDDLTQEEVTVLSNGTRVTDYKNGTVFKELFTGSNVTDQDIGLIVTEVFSNGTRVESLSDGTMNTTHQDGSQVVFAKGITATKFSNGTSVTNFGNGTVFKKLFNSNVTEQENGNIAMTEVFKNGTQVENYRNGTVIMSAGAEGRTIGESNNTISNKTLPVSQTLNGVTTIFYQNGTVFTQNLDKTNITAHLYGSITRVYPNLTKEVTFWNGTRIVTDSQGMQNVFETEIGQDYPNEPVYYMHGVKITNYQNGTYFAESPEGYNASIMTNSTMQTLEFSNKTKVHVYFSGTTALLKTTIFPNKTIVTNFKNETQSTKYPNGTIAFLHTNQTQVIYNAMETIRKYPNGTNSSTWYNSSWQGDVTWTWQPNGTVVKVYPGGFNVTESLTHGGIRVTRFPNGTVQTMFLTNNSVITNHTLERKNFLGEGIDYITEEPTGLKVIHYQNGSQLVEMMSGTNIQYTLDGKAHYKYPNGRQKTVRKSFNPEMYVSLNTRVYWSDGRNVTSSPDGCTYTTNFINGTVETFNFADNLKFHQYPNKTVKVFLALVKPINVLGNYANCFGDNSDPSTVFLGDGVWYIAESDDRTVTFFGNGNVHIEYFEGPNVTYFTNGIAEYREIDGNRRRRREEFDFELIPMDSTLMIDDGTIVTASADGCVYTTKFPNGTVEKFNYADHVKYHQYPNRTVKAFKANSIPFQIGKHDKDMFSCTNRDWNGTVENSTKMNYLPKGIWLITKEVSGRNTTFFSNGTVLVEGIEGASAKFDMDGIVTTTHKNGQVTVEREIYSREKYMSDNATFVHNNGINITASMKTCIVIISYPNRTVETYFWKEQLITIRYPNGTMETKPANNPPLHLDYENTQICQDQYTQNNSKVHNTTYNNSNTTRNVIFQNGTRVRTNLMNGVSRIYDKDGTFTIDMPNFERKTYFTNGTNSTYFYDNGSRYTMDLDGTNTTSFKNGSSLKEFSNGFKTILNEHASNVTLFTLDGNNSTVSNLYSAFHVSLYPQGVSVLYYNGTELFRAPNGLSVVKHLNGTVILSTSQNGTFASLTKNNFLLKTLSSGTNHTVTFMASLMSATINRNGSIVFYDPQVQRVNEDVDNMKIELEFKNGTKFEQGLDDSSRWKWTFRNGSKLISPGRNRKPMFVPASMPMSVLFIGNSYTSSNNMPEMVASMAEAAGLKLTFTVRAPPSATFKSHSRSSRTRRSLRSGRFDAVVLQEHSQIPSFSTEAVCQRSMPYLEQMVKDIAPGPSGTRPSLYFYQTWGRPRGDSPNCGLSASSCTFDAMTSRIRTTYGQFACRARPAMMVPVGVAFQVAMWSGPKEDQMDFSLFENDGWSHHPSVEGSYLSACVHFSRLFNLPCPEWQPYGIDPARAANLRWIAGLTTMKLGGMRDLGRDRDDERCYERCGNMMGGEKYN